MPSAAQYGLVFVTAAFSTRSASRRLRVNRAARSDLFQATGRVLVEEARDQRLVWQSLSQRPLLDRLQVLARQANVQPSVLLESRFCIAREARSFALTATGGLPLAPFHGLEQLLLVRANFHGRTPHRGTASWPSGSG